MLRTHGADPAIERILDGEENSSARHVGLVPQRKSSGRGLYSLGKKKENRIGGPQAPEGRKNRASKYGGGFYSAQTGRGKTGGRYANSPSTTFPPRSGENWGQNRGSAE